MAHAEFGELRKHLAQGKRVGPRDGVLQMFDAAMHHALASPRVLACRVDARTNHSKDVQKSLRDRFGRDCLSTYVRENVAVAESYSHAEPVYDYAPRSSGAEDYYAVSQEVAETFAKKTARKR